MAWARSLLLHPVIVAALLLCALAVRALVPAGYMPAVVGGVPRLELCPGTMPTASVAPAMTGLHGAMPMAGMHHTPEKHDAPASVEQPCAFAGLVAPAIGSADAVLLAVAIAFAFLLAVRGGKLLLPARPARLRPPLRAPPRPA